VGRQGLEP